MSINNQIRLLSRPKGRAAIENFEQFAAPVPETKDGEALVHMRWLAIDIGMANRLRDEKNYAARVEIGEPMHGTGIGEVVGGSHPTLKVGDTVRFLSGWQDYAIIGAEGAYTLLDLSIAAPEHYLSHLGDSGLAAYFGVTDVLRPEAGQQVVVSAAAGGVGALAGQIAKAMGCTVIGIAGGPDKCRHVVDRLGFDACVDHRAPDFAAQLATALPKGIDRYFDNVGGSLAQALLPHYNVFGKIAVCGRAGLLHLADTNDDIGLRDNNAILVKRLTKQGFLIYDYPDQFPTALKAMTDWYEGGKIVSDVTISDGLESAPAALVAVLTGGNVGKQIVRLNV